MMIDDVRVYVYVCCCPAADVFSFYMQWELGSVLSCFVTYPCTCRFWLFIVGFEICNQLILFMKILLILSMMI